MMLFIDDDDDHEDRSIGNDEDVKNGKDWRTGVGVSPSSLESMF